MHSAEMASRPTFSCAHRFLVCSAIDLLGTPGRANFCTYESVLARNSASEPSKKRRPSCMTKNRVVNWLLSARSIFPLSRIVAKIGHQMPVLIAVGDHDGGGVAQIALLDDQVDDGVGGDGIEAGGGRIVEHQCGAVTTARAIPTRRRMPPDSSLGNLSRVCSSSTKLSDSRTRRSTSSGGGAWPSCARRAD